MRPRIIGITGHKRAGKDTVAGFLEAWGYKRVGFADALKDMALDIDPVVWREVGPATHLSTYVEDAGWERAKEEPEVRRFLQRLGTEGVRKHIGEDAWIQALFHRLTWTGESGLFELGDFYVVPDVRFLNEAQAIRSWGGEIWRVIRPGYEGDGHASEVEQDQIQADFAITNDGARAGLRTAVEIRMAEEPAA